MALQKGPEANRWYPKIDRLPGFDFQRLLRVYADSNCAMFVGNMGTGTAVTKDAVLANNYIPLRNVHERKQASGDI